MSGQQIVGALMLLALFMLLAWVTARNIGWKDTAITVVGACAVCVFTVFACRLIVGVPL